MSRPETFYEVFRQQGISRRSFNKFCSLTATSLGLGPSFAPKIAHAMETKARTPVIWLNGLECTCCSESFIRSGHPLASDVVLSMLSLDYSHTLMASAGHQAEQILEETRRDSAGNYLLAVEGNPPLNEDGMFCIVGGRAFVEQLKEMAADAIARGRLILEEAMQEAVKEATARSYLRPNAVDTLTGKNTGDGSGKAIPFLHFVEWDEPRVEVRLILKGGGCENVGVQYKLPEVKLKAGRDLEGVRRVILDAVVQAQGKGCAPGVLGVCIGGDRVSGFSESKCQLLRSLDDQNPDPELAELEERLLKEANELGIGPMGFGGKTTALGVKIGLADRIPASYYVSVAYMCWACRRRQLSFTPAGRFTVE